MGVTLFLLHHLKYLIFGLIVTVAIFLNLSPTASEEPQRAILQLTERGAFTMANFITHLYRLRLLHFTGGFLETYVGLENMPTEVKIPDHLKNKVFYNASTKLLTFKGIMSEGEKQELLGLSQGEPFQKAVEVLFQRSSLYSDDKLRSLFVDSVKDSLKEIEEINRWERPRLIFLGSKDFVINENGLPDKDDMEIETSEKLNKLLERIQFPDSLKGRIRHDDAKQLLIFRGIMKKEEKDELLTLSEDSTYKAAVERLFRNSQMVPLPLGIKKDCVEVLKTDKPYYFKEEKENYIIAFRLIPKGNEEVKRLFSYDVLEDGCIECHRRLNKKVTEKIIKFPSDLYNLNAAIAFRIPKK